MQPVFFRRTQEEMLLPILLQSLLACFFAPFVHPMEPSTSRCLNFSVPYPFVIANGGSLLSQQQGFQISCANGSDSSKLRAGGPVLPIGDSVFGILDISLLGGFVTIMASTNYQQCNDRNSIINLEGSIFTFSDARNKFTALGCNVVAMLLNSTGGGGYSGGCASFCSNKNNIIDGSCSGVGCCQSPMPKGLKKLELEFETISTKGSSTPTCGEAFIVEQNSYVFSSIDLNNTNNTNPPYRQVVLEWSIVDADGSSCEEAKHLPLYACTENTYCYNSSNGIGYRCNCSEGYEGNPYLQGPGGCQDIDECSTRNPCTHKCKNTKGSFKCMCPSGMSGDGLKQGSGCNGVSTLQIAIVVGLALLLLLLILGFWTHWLIKKRKLAKTRQRFFMQNGGLLLKQQMFSERAPLHIFTSNELNKATNNFSDDNIVGRGGFGTVYKGILSNQGVVAIKKAQRVDQTQMEQFVNELIILSQANHKNVVQLLGCCLETEVPLLVYEFITNGALFHHLHNTSAPMSWENRLSIAAETASALAHLHLATDTPIIHRDVKSSNILLDKNFTAKVSDFGASRPIPSNQTHVTTLVQGTLGYMDPEYFQTSQLTEKSDVYSFGVVLLELLTRKKPIMDGIMDDVRSLALQFSLLFYQNKMMEIVDPEVAEEAGIRQVETVAKLALRCLRLKGEERPRMVEVAIELEALRSLMRQHLIILKNESLPQESWCHEEMDIDMPPSLCRLDNGDTPRDESMEIVLLPSKSLSP
ncbi:hypothetical protein U9M48_033682 [Paspalum notatum var. saurae]|uniref:Uncharacterized protein n=1 Tax=Paspalum notatum var. saurae TaxID=547442 RepID=A0AAQ3U8X2_PASNO